MDINEELMNIPKVSMGAGWAKDDVILQTMKGKMIPYRHQGKDVFDYHATESRLDTVKEFKNFLEEIPSPEERKVVMTEEFKIWDDRHPDIYFAAWLIHQYETADILCRRDQRRLAQAAKGEKKSWEELLRERDEKISELRSLLNEKEAIIAQKTREHDDYVANHSTSDDDGTKWLMKIDKTDIYLTLREYTIILYTLFRRATNKEDISANLKRLIGSYNTVSSYINDAKKGGRNPLTQEEKDNIKKVLKSERISYQNILQDYL